VDQPASPFYLGTPINVTFTVRNVTGTDIYLSSTKGKDGILCDFRFFLARGGREVETTFLHRKMTGRNREGDPSEVWSGSSILLPHPPGTIFVITVDLRRLYEITEPGEYTLDVSRQEDNQARVRAKTVTLKIVP
jgi:hypothetical protein